MKRFASHYLFAFHEWMQQSVYRFVAACLVVISIAYAVVEIAKELNG